MDDKLVDEVRRMQTAVQAELSYLACPYTDPDPAIRAARFYAVNRKAAELIRDGKLVFSPISHSHPIVEFGLPLDFEFWGRWNWCLLNKCDRLIVLCLDGWRESKGVQAEIALAREAGLPVEFVNA